MYCKGLTSVTLPNSLTSIGHGAFLDCVNIENFYCYAEQVPSAGYGAFGGYSMMLLFTSLHLQSRLIKQQNLGGTLELLKLSIQPKVLNQ